MKKNNIVAFIHAKGTSTRVPSKNLRMLGEYPLFVHAIQNAKNSHMIDEVIIDSDSDEILEIGQKHGASPLKRPFELANNSTTGDQLAYWQASNRPSSDIILQVIPTSPFIKTSSIDRGISLLLNNNINSVTSMFKEVVYQWINEKPIYYNSDGSIPNSFTMDPIIYETTGLYINKTQFTLKEKKRLDIHSMLPLFISKLESIDINNEEDFEFASIIVKGLKEDS